MRSFERSTWFLIVCIVALAAVLCAGAYQAMAAPPCLPPEIPLAALYAITWNEAGIATDTNSTAYLTQNYAYHDVYCSVAFYSTGAVSITIQSSPAGTTYYDVYELGQITSATDVFTRVMSYGRYERMAFDVQGTNLLTPTCKSVYFNNWTPGFGVATVE